MAEENEEQKQAREAQERIQKSQEQDAENARKQQEAENKLIIGFVDELTSHFHENNITNVDRMRLIDRVYDELERVKTVAAAAKLQQPVREVPAEKGPGVSTISVDLESAGQKPRPGEGQPTANPVPHPGTGQGAVTTPRVAAPAK